VRGKGPLAAALLFAGLLATAKANADPQGHVAVRTAFCGTGEASALWQTTEFCGGVIGDLLFLRSDAKGIGVGPYLELTTAGFWDVRWGGGGSALLPVHEDFPLVLQLGAYGHELSAVALGGSVFWGIRGYNFTSAYNLAAGVFVSFQRDLDARGANLVSAGFELDGVLLAMPFLLAWRALE